jgi:hypothetical protein
MVICFVTAPNYESAVLLHPSGTLFHRRALRPASLPPPTATGFSPRRSIRCWRRLAPNWRPAIARQWSCGHRTGSAAGREPVAVSGGDSRPSSRRFAPLPCRLELRVEPASGDEVFHPTTLVNFRQRLLDHDLSTLGFELVLEALIEAGLVARQSRQRLDSTQMFGRVSRMSRLDCVRESLRLALPNWPNRSSRKRAPSGGRSLWERYVDSQADYRASLETLARKMVEAGTDAQQVLDWLATPPAQELAAGKASGNCWPGCLREQFEVVAG